MAPAPAATATTATSVGGSPRHGVRRLGLTVCGGLGLWRNGVRRLGFVGATMRERPFLYTGGRRGMASGRWTGYWAAPDKTAIWGHGWVR